MTQSKNGLVSVLYATILVGIIVGFTLGVRFFSTTKERVLNNSSVVTLDSSNLQSKVSFSNAPQWATPKYNDSTWESITIPDYSHKESRYYRDGNTNGEIYYRLQITISKELQRSSEELSFSPAYVAFDRYQIYVNGILKTSGNGPSARGAYTLVSLSKDDISSGTVIIGIKGIFKSGNVGLHHRSKMVIGPTSLLKELAIHKERVMITYYFFWILPLGTLLILFSSLYFTASHSQSYKYLIHYILLLMLSLLVSSDFLATTISLLLRLGILCLSIVLTSIVLMRAMTYASGFSKRFRGTGIIEFLALLLGAATIIMSLPSINMLSLKAAIQASYFINKFVIIATLALAYSSFKNRSGSPEGNVKWFSLVTVLYLIGSSYFVYKPFNYYLPLPDLMFCVFIAYITVRLFAHNQKELLIKEQKLKELAIKAVVGETAREMAHDLKQPFSLMSTVLENFDTFNNSPKELSKARREVQSSLNHVKLMVEELINYRHQKATGEESVSIESILKQLIQKENFVSHDSEISFNYNFKATLCPLINKTKLTRVFGNLIENAIEAITEIGGHNKGTINISTEEIERYDIPYISIEVSNNGPKIPTEKLNEIFNSGYTSGKSKGHGIGLSSVRRIIELAGGEITASNNPFGGVTFNIILKSSTVKESNTIILPPDLKNINCKSGQSILKIDPDKIVYVVDDSSITREYLKSISEEILEQNGNFTTKVSSHTNSNHLLASMSAKTPGLLLCDLNLEGESGIDIIREVKSMNSSIDCYLMTNHLPDEMVEEVLKLGVVRVLIQPISSATLAEIFQQSGL